MVNLNYGAEGRANKRQNRVERGAPLGKSAIGRGALTIYSTEGLIVEGSSKVAGTQNVTGVQNVSGTSTVTGTSNLNGPTHIGGATDISGTLAVNGATTVTGNMTVTGGGKITVAGSIPAVLGITTSGLPGLQMGSGSVNGATGGLAVTGGTSGLIVSNSGILAIGNTDIQNILTNSGIPTKSGVVANLYVDSAGKFWKVI